MLKEEFLEMVKSTAVDKSVVAKIEETYGPIKSDDVCKILSLTSKRITVGDLRLLSTTEIACFEDVANVDLSCMKLLPVFDAFDNEFVVYRLKKGTWSMFNIVDRIEFNEAETFESYLS